MNTCIIQNNWTQKKYNNTMINDRSRAQESCNVIVTCSFFSWMKYLLFICCALCYWFFVFKTSWICTFLHMDSANGTINCFLLGYPWAYFNTLHFYIITSMLSGALPRSMLPRIIMKYITTKNVQYSKAMNRRFANLLYLLYNTYHLVMPYVWCLYNSLQCGLHIFIYTSYGRGLFMVPCTSDAA